MKEEIKESIYIGESILTMLALTSIAASLLVISIKGFDKLDRYFDSHTTGVISIEVVKERESFGPFGTSFWKNTTTTTNHMTGKHSVDVFYGN